MKAQPVQFTFAGQEFTAFVNESGRYISVPEMYKAGLISGRPDHASRSLKAIAGNSLEVARLSVPSEFGKNVTAISTSDFSMLVMKLALKGNDLAKALLEAVLEQALDRRIDIALGIQVCEKEREAWLNSRVTSKVARRKFTDSVKEYGVREGVKPDYAKLTAMFYNMTGLKVNRDNYTANELCDLIYYERLVSTYIDNGFSPEQALYKMKVLVG